MTATSAGPVRRVLRRLGCYHVDLAYSISVGFTVVTLALFTVPLAVLAFAAPGTGPGRRALHATRRAARFVRSYGTTWHGGDHPDLYLPAPYLPRPPRQDPATRRDLAFFACEPLVGTLLLLVPAAIAWHGLFGLTAPAVVYYVGGGHGAFHAGPFDSAAAALPSGVALYIAALLLARAGRFRHGRWLPVLLGPAPFVASDVAFENERRHLVARVAELAETRTATLDSAAAELRRIERDLHDGAQARLVALGMNLGALDALMEADPARARRLLTQMQDDSTKALNELRDLVRGIHPPVLAERGLADAVRALALDAPMEAEVDAVLPGRPEPPIESALYFAVSELLANAAKHSGADTVRITLHYEDGDREGKRDGDGNGVLRCTVRDDGRGGADPDAERGSGLSGVRRRLAAFDGKVEVHSPVGGPTLVKMEIPCALSSPRTYSSSATDSSTS
ncbi:sensor histidine kinase [Nocardia transvalensis]|uniref:sensor histidine kinase n=1 Tax=Nocardia transvalensis TaxID=37333 RepID=UPI0018943C81|nr:sensor histidine kinase [Nocardia transvalensis]MBF6331119.1 sensor histidine kinase [Nocardia transvalensis]